MSDTLKIKAAAFAVRAGHTDEMAQALVEELSRKGQLGMPGEYGPTLAALMKQAAAPESARSKLLRVFERHASSAAAASVADEILGDHRQELAGYIRKTVEDDVAYRPKWADGMLDAAKLIEAVE